MSYTISYAMTTIYKTLELWKLIRIKDERYAIMTTEFKNIAYIASFDQSSYNMVKEKLADIYHLLAVDHPIECTFQSVVIRPLLMTYLFQLHRPRQKLLPHEYCHYCHYYLIISVSLIFYLCLNKGVVILSLVCNSSPLI